MILDELVTNWCHHRYFRKGRACYEMALAAADAPDLPLLAEAADLQEELTGERPHVVEDNHSQSYTPLSSRLNFCDLTWLGVPDYQE